MNSSLQPHTSLPIVNLDDQLLRAEQHFFERLDQQARALEKSLEQQRLLDQKYTVQINEMQASIQELEANSMRQKVQHEESINSLKEFNQTLLLQADEYELCKQYLTSRLEELEHYLKLERISAADRSESLQRQLELERVNKETLERQLELERASCAEANRELIITKANLSYTQDELYRLFSVESDLLRWQHEATYGFKKQLRLMLSLMKSRMLAKVKDVLSPSFKLYLIRIYKKVKSC